jgi:hypothetical protein
VPRCQFHQHLKAAFYTDCFSQLFLHLQFGFVFFWPNNIVEKAAQKMLVKLTAGSTGK